MKIYYPFYISSSNNIKKKLFVNDNESNIINLNSKCSSDNYESNENSIISEGTFLSSKELINISKNTSNKKKPMFKHAKKFVNYKELIDYYECPLTKKESSSNKFNNFVQLLDNIDEILDNKSSKRDDSFGEEPQIICLDINDIVIKVKEDNEKKYLSEGKIMNYYKKNNSKMESLNISLRNDLSETRDKTIISTNSNKIINSLISPSKKEQINKPDKTQEISNKIKKKYLNMMNEEYISIMKKLYLSLFQKSSTGVNIIKDEILLKKFFIQNFKQLLLNFGINHRNYYGNIIKCQLFKNRIITFDEFIQCFDTLINDNDKNTLKMKFLFLLNILPSEIDNNEIILTKDTFNTFFDFLGCDVIYIENFCENIGNKLFVRYNAIYEQFEEENITNGKFNLRKMKAILETFFDKI